MPRSTQEEQYQILTVRLVPDDILKLKAAAKHIGVGPSILARMLIRQGLQTQEAERPHFPFASLQPLFTSVSHSKGIYREEAFPTDQTSTPKTLGRTI